MNIETLVEKWFKLKPNESEADLNAKFTNHIWDLLGYHYKVNPNISPGMKPDYVLFDENKFPLLVVETKKRIPELAVLEEINFVK